MSPATIRITGAVDRERSVDGAAMHSLPGAVTDAATVAEGAVGGAAPVAALLALSSPTATATHCTVIADEGAYQASIPLADLTTGGWIAFELGGEPLPHENGGPFRLTVASGSTLCWNVKHVAMLRLTDGPEEDDVPENPPH